LSLPRPPAKGFSLSGKSNASAGGPWRLVPHPMRILTQCTKCLGRAFAGVAFASVLAVSSPARAQDVKIPLTKSALANGMTVILSEDHAVPQVVVNVTYGVGSRMERTGRTGFAHLFEHLMFMGTRRAPTKAFDAWMEEAGGRNNAWTAEDRTD